MVASLGVSAALQRGTLRLESSTTVQKELTVPFDLWFIFVGLGAAALLVGLLLMLGRGGVRTGRSRKHD